MEWILILALAFWVWRQGRRIEALQRRIETLETREPTPAQDDVLVLDTPLPQASNDDDAFALEEAAPPQAEPTLVLAEPLPPREEEAPLLLTEALPEQAHQRRRQLEQWLAENGLAWMGGGAFALGGIMLVALAAQQSWFTPLVRLYCALALGAGLIGASEWLLRRPGAHKLAAALLAGAGAATFYATIWAGHALYGFIGAGAAVWALVICALVFMALAFRHGQALAIAAIFAAFMAPALAGGALPGVSAMLYLGAVAAAGFAVAALRRWAWAGVACLLSLYFWFAAAIGSDDLRNALALAALAAIGGAALSLRKPLQAQEPGALSWARAQKLGPAVAISISSVALLWIWGAAAAAQQAMVAGPAWVGAMLVALAAGAVRLRLAAPAVLAVAIGALAVGFMMYLGVRTYMLPPSLYPFMLFSAGIVAAAAMNARPHRRERAMLSIAGALGAGLLTLLAAFSASDWHGAAAWAPLFIGAAALLSLAAVQAQSVAQPRASAAVDAWAIGGAVLAIAAVESLVGAAWRTAAHAGLALIFAFALGARGWRALGWAALAAAALALAHGFSDATVGGAMAGGLLQALSALGLAAGLLFAAAWFAARTQTPSSISEALSAGAIILSLLGVYLMLRWIAAGGAGAPLDRFTEAGLRGCALMAGAHLALARPKQKLGRIGAWRGHVLMALGVLQIMLSNGLMLNPWWGVAPAAIGGPALFNALALGIAAPAALLLFAARRLYPHQREPARAYAGAGAVLALLWAVLEIRRAFHGAEMAAPLVFNVECAAYGLLFLCAGVLNAVLAQRWRGRVGADLAAIRDGMALGAMALGGLLLLLGLIGGWDRGAGTGFVLVLALLAGAALALAQGALISKSENFEAPRFAAAALACVLVWSAGHGAIHWARLGGLEGMAHALWPLALTLAGAARARRSLRRDAWRAYRHDLQAIWASAAWPAGAIAALGLWGFANPWWGLGGADGWGQAIGAIALCGAGAWMSFKAAQVPHVRKAMWFAPAARVAAAAHVLVALTLLVRASFHGGALGEGGAEGAELWTYSAVWALYGAGVLGLGAVRDDAVLRWCGLALLFLTAGKVFAFDTARLSGVIRAASLLGLAAVAMLTALAIRRIRTRAP